MSDIINFNIKLPVSCFKHIKEKSCYDHNYYKVKDYGDWFYGICDALLQEYSESDDCYSYSLGKVENDKFIPMIFWTTEKDIFNED